VRWGLRPVRSAARQIAAITATNLGSTQLASADAPREIGPFVHALNDLLVRLADAFRQQRNFTAYASHELRTPMAVIKSTIQTCLLRQRQSADYRDALAEVLDDLIGMEHMVDQLLLLARLDAGDEPPNREPVDLGELLADVVQYHQSLAAEADVTLAPPNTLASPVRGNRELLERMLANLVGNAIRHNRRGGQVTASSGLEMQDGSPWAVVEIADTGPGIPADALNRIFDRFFRVDKSRSRCGGGTGLGLSIVREIVQRHGGTVTAENRPEGGALFRVRLPALASEPERSAVGRGPDAAVPEGIASGRGDAGIAD